MLQDVLKPGAFWQLLTQCRALHDAAVGGTVDSSFKDFWLLAKEVVKDGSMVYTSTGSFCATQSPRRMRVSETGTVAPFSAR